MTKIMHLPTPQRDRGSAPMKPVAMQNVVAIRTLRRVPMIRARQAELELLDRIRIWINEGGGGGDVQ
jgi:hypothetical protein